MKSALPYASATSGDAARGEINRILRRFGCGRIGFTDDIANHALILEFEHKGRNVFLSASAKGWAEMYLKENPWNNYRRKTEREWRKHALEQGITAVNSILRDWVKGQVAAVECGIMSFNAVFMPHMLTESGIPLIEMVEKNNLLPPPRET